MVAPIPHSARRPPVDPPSLRQIDVVPQPDRRPGDASVENVGVKVRAVWPRYSPQTRFDADLREVRRSHSGSKTPGKLCCHFVPPPVAARPAESPKFLQPQSPPPPPPPPPPP